ncbi:hypothetical protein [Bacillus mobilis]|uniref:hypothetical protein n=1 Tax=Bacillus mobilis TaxID=2026190 RepID=UPI0022E5E3A9|nr:hypothetical protein [Bacillus mobilis]
MNSLPVNKEKPYSQEELKKWFKQTIQIYKEVPRFTEFLEPLDVFLYSLGKRLWLIHEGSKIFKLSHYGIISSREIERTDSYINQEIRISFGMDMLFGLESEDKFFESKKSYKEQELVVRTNINKNDPTYNHINFEHIGEEDLKFSVPLWQFGMKLLGFCINSFRNKGSYNSPLDFSLNGAVTTHVYGNNPHATEHDVKIAMTDAICNFAKEKACYDSFEYITRFLFDKKYLSEFED